MELPEDNWSAIKRAITLAVQLLSSFGFSGQNLRVGSAILPIAYCLYLRDPGGSDMTQSDNQDDREAVREWLIRSLLKASGIWVTSALIIDQRRGAVLAPTLRRL